MMKVEYSSCSGPSYTDLLPQASAAGNGMRDGNVKKHKCGKFEKKKKTCAWHLTLHLDQFGHVCAEQRVNPLGLSVTIYIQLDVCREAAEKNEACME